MNKFITVGGVLIKLDYRGEPEYSFQLKDFTITKLVLNKDTSTIALPSLKDLYESKKPLKIEKLCQSLLRSYEAGRAYKDGIVAQLVSNYIDGEIRIDENVFSSIKNLKLVLPNTNSYRFLSGAFRDVESVNLQVAKPSRVFDLTRQEWKGAAKSLLVANPVIYSAPVEDAMQSRMLVYSLRPQEPMFQDTDIKADLNVTYINEDESE